MPDSARQRWISAALLLMLFTVSLLLSEYVPAAPADAETGEANPPAAPGDAGQPKQQSRHITEYHIRVALDAENKTLQGKEVVTWTHPGNKPVRDLVFHLYPNAFASMNTTFNKESGGKLRGDKIRDQRFGRMDIRSIATSDGQDLTGRLQYIQPDDGNAQDRTLAVLRLYEPVEPGQKISLQIEFRVQLPFAYARMGYVGDFVMAGQWFPKLAAYETAGMRGRTEEGWNMHQYHGNSEFYADFGMYNVQIAVPEPYTVAATGFPTGPASIRNGMKVYRFYADDVHDFAWAASPHFVVAEEPFSSKHVPGVKIRLYLDPAHAHLKDRYLYVAKKALARYSEWYGSYPYSTLSIVVPPPGGNGAGGMEYPNLITAWAADDDNPDLELERVVAHEIAHQFWYGMVANNEFEEAWLDEGLTSYAEDKFMQAEFGVRSARMLEASYITDPAPLKLHAWEYGNHNVYAENVYMRAKLVLLDIESKIGEKRMNDVLRRYFQEWRFRHPSTGDFQQVLERVTGKNWDDYFNQYVYGGRMADVAVQSVRSAPVEIRGETVYDNRVIVDSRDGVVDNVTVRIQFADGSRTDVNWDGAGGKTEIRLLSRSPVKWVLVDPQFDLVLENRRTNNFYQTDVDEKQKVRLNVGISKLIEAAVGWIAW